MTSFSGFESEEKYKKSIRKAKRSRRKTTPKLIQINSATVIASYILYRPSAVGLLYKERQGREKLLTRRLRADGNGQRHAGGAVFFLFFSSLFFSFSSPFLLFLILRKGEEKKEKRRRKEEEKKKKRRRKV